MKTYRNPSDLVREILGATVGQVNMIAIPLVFVRLTGDFTAGAFLTQCVYWSYRTTDPDGWFHKTHDQWEEELHISPKQVRRCLDDCEGIVEVKLRGVPARNHYRVDFEILGEAIRLDQERNSKMRPKVTSGSDQVAQLVSDQREHLRTETTSENTPETTEKTGGLSPTPATQEGDQTNDQTTNARAVIPAQEQLPGTPGTSKRKRGSKVAPGPGARRLLDLWNEHRGELPEIVTFSDARLAAAQKILDELGEESEVLFVAAVHEVAQDRWWIEHDYNFDNLAGKVAQKAEAWRNKQRKQQKSPMARRTYQ